MGGRGKCVNGAMGTRKNGQKERREIANLGVIAGKREDVNVEDGHFVLYCHFFLFLHL